MKTTSQFVLLFLGSVLPVLGHALPGYHAADTDYDSRISPAEFQRVRELYEYTADHMRTGEYSRKTGTVDGFQPGPGGQVGTPHSADFNKDWRISPLELARVAELMNWPQASQRTGEYHFSKGTLDGFAAGPPMGGVEFTIPENGLVMVALPAGWWIGKYEVTQAEYQAIMGTNPSCYRGPRRPVEGNMGGWYAATNYCGKLTERERAAGRLPAGKVYRLPTEQEWEYACRAGTATEYYWGNDEGPVDQFAWYGLNSGGSTHDVGGKKPNAWGLYDMAGNVSEWTLTESGSNRVARGGSLYDPTNLYRSSASNGHGPGAWSCALGFRVTLAPAQ